MSQTLLVRADSNGTIGTGHVMRCLALAQAWRDEGGTCFFIGSIEDGNLERLMRDDYSATNRLAHVHPDPRDLDETRAFAKRLRPDWLVLDGYHFDTAYQRALFETGIPLLLLDDDARWGTYFATVLLNQNIEADGLVYRSPVPVEFLLGPRFVLLRREFHGPAESPRVREEDGLRLLVTLGGADPENVTSLVLEALARVTIPDLKIKVVAGAANPHRRRLREAVESLSKRAELIEDAPDMARIMSWADVAVSAAGTTCWELCFMGIPAIAIVLAENQRRIAEGLSRAGAAANLGWYAKWNADSLSGAIEPLLRDPGWRFRTARLARRLVDGRGARRVVERLREGRGRRGGGEYQCG